MAEDLENKRGKGRPKGFNRESALRVALRMFWENGYEPTSVAALCEAMDINPPSLYCCFGSKAKLFLEAARYYENAYWREPAERLMDEPEVYKAIDDFFREAAKIMLSPHTPRGCMIVLAAVNISPKETEIIEAIRSMRMETKDLFSKRLARAIMAGQLPAETDVPTISGALNTFLEGLSLQARDGLFLSQLLDLAGCAARILPPKA